MFEHQAPPQGTGRAAGSPACTAHASGRRLAKHGHTPTPSQRAVHADRHMRTDTAHSRHVWVHCSHASQRLASRRALRLRTCTQGWVGGSSIAPRALGASTSRRSSSSRRSLERAKSGVEAYTRGRGDRISRIEGALSGGSDSSSATPRDRAHAKGKGTRNRHARRSPTPRMSALPLVVISGDTPGALGASHGAQLRERVHETASLYITWGGNLPVQ